MKLFVIFFLTPLVLFGQQKDSTRTNNTDSFEYENLVKNRLWGNCWQTSISVSLDNALANRKYLNSTSQSIVLNVGRTFGSTFAGCVTFGIKTRSYGLGYGFALEENKYKSLINSYWEFSIVQFPILPLGLRADYFFNVNDLRSSVRASIGASFVYFDILYYSTLNFNKADGLYGLTFRLKYFYKRKDWQHGFAN